MSISLKHKRGPRYWITENVQDFSFLRKSALFLPLFMAFAQGLKAHGQKQQQQNQQDIVFQSARSILGLN